MGASFKVCSYVDMLHHARWKISFKVGGTLTCSSVKTGWFPSWWLMFYHARWMISFKVGGYVDNILSSKVGASFDAGGCVDDVP